MSSSRISGSCCGDQAVYPAKINRPLLAATHEGFLKMEATCSSESPADFRKTTRIPEDRTLHVFYSLPLSELPSKSHE
jgi:hypothetical protein